YENSIKDERDTHSMSSVENKVNQCASPPPLASGTSGYQRVPVFPVTSCGRFDLY
ncbi:Hypothetical predicted protein, partial [Olea europaea subsp. europaea]